MANTRKQPFDTSFFEEMGMPPIGGAAATGSPGMGYNVLTPATTVGEEEPTTDPYLGMFDPSMLAGMYPPPEEAPPPEEDPVTGGLLPAYAQAFRPALPEPIASGGYPYDKFTERYLAPNQESEESDPSQTLADLTDKQSLRDANMPKEAKPLPGYSFMKPTAQQQRGASFLLPMSRSEQKLSDAGYKRPAERGQWLRSLRVKKGYF
jgi:hypothetical protein